MKRWGHDPIFTNVEWKNVIHRTEETWDDGIVFWCFPENIKNVHRPYPGFEVLEIWLEDNYPDVTFEREYNNGSPVLLVKFRNKQDAFFFALISDQRNGKFVG